MKEKFDPLSYLKWLRDGNSNEIPNEILSGHSEKKFFKVRRNWWNGLVGGLSSLLRKGLVKDEKTLGDIQNFLKKYNSDEFRFKPLTEAVDIAAANALLDEIVGPKE